MPRQTTAAARLFPATILRRAWRATGTSSSSPTAAARSPTRPSPASPSAAAASSAACARTMRKTREALAAEVQATLFEGDLDEETWERLEEALIYADVGARTTAEVVERLEREAEEGDLVGGEALTAPAGRAARRARPHRRRHDRHPPRARR